MKYYIGDIPYGEKELYHFGVKGMKWGVRRYQNEDGTLTAAGKERYSQASGPIKNAKTGRKAVEDLRKLTGDALRKRQNEALKDMARFAENPSRMGADEDLWANEIYKHFF